jgi:hypothetical protein
MYQYAYIRSVAERNDYDFCILAENHESSTYNYFNDVFPHLEIRKNVIFDRVYRLEEVNYDFKEYLYNLTNNVHVDGYFQNNEYFKIEDVKKWFEIYLNENETIEFDNIINKYNPDEYCYIYYRGNDFIKIKHYETKPQFYIDAKGQTNIKKYLVITDDIENAKRNIDADDYINVNYKVSLKLLTKSYDLIICGWSSFGWWGAWLSDANKIIAPNVNDVCYIKNDRFIYI